jgi:exonuclease VII large subunit
LSALARGYSVALDETGRVLRSVEHFTDDADFTLRVSDGRVQAKVESTQKEETS